MKLNIRSDLGYNWRLHQGHSKQKKNRRLRKVAKTEKFMDTLIPFSCTKASEIHTAVRCCLIFLHCAIVTQKTLSIRNLPLQGTALNYFMKYFLHSIISVPSSKYLIPCFQPNPNTDDLYFYIQSVPVDPASMERFWRLSKAREMLKGPLTPPVSIF